MGLVSPEGATRFSIGLDCSSVSSADALLHRGGQAPGGRSGSRADAPLEARLLFSRGSREREGKAGMSLEHEGTLKAATSTATCARVCLESRGEKGPFCGAAWTA